MKFIQEEWNSWEVVAVVDIHQSSAPVALPSPCWTKSFLQTTYMPDDDRFDQLFNTLKEIGAEFLYIVFLLACHIICLHCITLWNELKWIQGPICLHMSAYPNSSLGTLITLTDVFAHKAPMAERSQFSQRGQNIWQ